MSYHDITVVITTFKSESKIYDCLNSINPSVKIIVIENSNNFKFKEKLETEYPNLKCYLAGENLGYAKGNNLGLSKVKTKFALIINPDARLGDSALENFFKSSKIIPNFAIISPYLQEQNNNSVNKFSKIQELVEVNSVKGFAMFLNIEQFKDIGYFDDNFFIYFEEIDLCRRIKKMKKNIYLDPSIKIFHAGGQSHDVSVNFEMELSRNWHWMWSTFYYHKKYKGYLIALIAVSPKLISAFLKTIFYSLTLRKEKKLIYFQRASGLTNAILCKKSWYRPKVN
tara:strand:- start:222 stop:1070 length:849 start_codon:yes stop_codon:yes gene_type:complete